MKNGNWRYLQFLLNSGGAATTGTSFLPSLRYAKHVFGYTCFDEVINSRRVLGAWDILYTNKRELKQALVLTVSQLLELRTGSWLIRAATSVIEHLWHTSSRLSTREVGILIFVWFDV